MKRTLAKLLSALMAGVMVFSLAGCGSAPAEETQPDETASSGTAETEEQTGESVLITVGMPSSWTQFGGITDQIEAWAEETGNEVDIQAVADEQITQQLTAKLATGECFDVVFTDGSSRAAMINPQKNFMDLSEEPWVGRITEFAKQFITFDGKVLAAPFCGLSATGIVYNKTVFEENGLSVPTTYEELENACKVLLDAGVTPFFAAGSESWTLIQWQSAVWANILKQQPGLMDKLNANELRWDEIPEYVDELTHLDTLIKSGYFNKDIVTATYADSIEALGSGSAAMCFQGTWMAGEILAIHPDAELGMFAPPSEDGDPYGALAGCNAIYAYNQSAYPEQAKDLIRYLCEPEQLESFYSIKPDISVWTDVVPENMDPCSADMYELQKENKCLIPYNMNYAVATDDQLAVISELFLQQKSPKEVATDMAEAYLKAGKQAQVPGF